jgi:hypothetical protein
MTDQTKKDDKPQGSEQAKAEAVKDALSGKAPENAAKPTESAKRTATGGTGEPDKKPVATPPPSGAKPEESAKDPAKPGASAAANEPPKASSVPPSGSKPAEAARQPVKPGVPPGGKEPPQGPATPSAAARTPEPKKPAAKPKKKHGCLGMLIWLVVIIAALGVGAYYSWPYWPEAVKKPVEAKIAGLIPQVETPEAKAALDDRLAKHDEQLAALKSRVDEVAGRKSVTESDVAAMVDAAGGTQDGELKQLASRIEAVELALANLATGETTRTGNAAVATAAVGASVQSLSKRVAQLESEVAAVAKVEARITEVENLAKESPPGETRAAALLAVGQIGDALSRSGPFTGELESLKAVSADDAGIAAAVAALEPYAASGIPTLLQLRSRFPSVAHEISRVNAEWTGRDWVDQAVNRLTRLVSIRKTGAGAAAEGGVSGALASAEAALASDDLAAAVAALEGLEGPPAEAAAPWLKDARDRLAAEKALANLRDRAISMLATGG